MAKLDAVSALGFGTDEERMVGLQSAGVTLRTGSLATQVIDPVDMLHPYTIYIYICIYMYNICIRYILTSIHIEIIKINVCITVYVLQYMYTQRYKQIYILINIENQIKATATKNFFKVGVFVGVIGCGYGARNRNQRWYKTN